MNKQKALEKMNLLGSLSRSFMFIIDFDLENPRVFTPDEAQKEGIRIDFSDSKSDNHYETKTFSFSKYPVSYSTYLESFNVVHRELTYGNSYLINLTLPTMIDTDLTLKEIYQHSRAPYKLMVPEKFVVFSPESFVKISSGYISAFPMKGTINANHPEAQSTILSDLKEQAEHATIVDLLRNDLSMVSTNVKVKKYRYVERIEKKDGALLQVSSEITGELPTGYKSNLGDIIFRLLPAGSVTGAPKEKTVEIIKKAENYQRGYFTGIFGYFDGKKLESAVSIRFIEKTRDGFIFKSGGGITAQSVAEKEYNELIEKVYVPIV